MKTQVISQKNDSLQQTMQRTAIQFQMVEQIRQLPRSENPELHRLADEWESIAKA